MRWAHTRAEAGDMAVAVYEHLVHTVATPLAGALANGTHRADVDTARLAPGVYVVRVTAATGAGELVRTARLTVVP